MVVVEALIAFLILGGAFFLLVGSYGLAKLPDLMRRLHGPTKATTLGVGAMLVASMLFFMFVHGELSAHELLIILFLFLTTPVSAQMIAKVFILGDRGARKALPETGRPVGWATLDAIAAEPIADMGVPERPARSQS